ncbi:MAG: leucine-rich repeat protein [Alistipes sp.]|nr:leucine-rich repeat protein [Alistipes sp.]
MKKLFVLLTTAFVVMSCGSKTPQPNEIWYTTTNGFPILSPDVRALNANLISNEYKGDKGILKFDAPIAIIGEKAFYKCHSLSSVTIPNGVVEIREAAFACCGCLRSVTIPQSVASIKEDAFEGCSSLSKVEIEDLVAWCNINFETVTSNPLLYAQRLYLNGTELTEFSLPPIIKTIKDYAFVNCTSLTRIVVPEGVESIGDGESIC